MQVVVFLHIPYWELIIMKQVEIVHFLYLILTTPAMMNSRKS